MNNGVSPHGFALSEGFANHKRDCKQCQRHKGSAATLSLLCLQGAVLWKVDNPAPRPTRVATPELAQGQLCDSKRVGAAAAKCAMRYKE